MIGDGDGRQSAPPCKIDDLRWGIAAVAERAVDVQIDAAVIARPRQRLAELSKWLTGRHDPSLTTSFFPTSPHDRHRRGDRPAGGYLRPFVHLQELHQCVARFGMREAVLFQSRQYSVELLASVITHIS